MKIFVVLAAVTATSLAAPYYGTVMDQQWPSTQISRSARSSTAADFAVDGKLEEDPTARTHKLLKKPLFSHHHLHRPFHHFRENEDNVASQVQDNKNLLQTEDKVELHLNTEHVHKTSGRDIGSVNANVFEEKVQPLKEKSNDDLTQMTPIEDHGAQISMINSGREQTQHSESTKITADMMMGKSKPHHFEARGAYDAGAGLSGGSAILSSGGSGPVIGVFSNANIGGCAVPVLLSCSPSIVSGTLSKPHSYGYGAGTPAYRTSEDFHMHNMREDMKKLL